MDDVAYWDGELAEKLLQVEKIVKRFKNNGWCSQS